MPEPSLPMRLQRCWAPVRAAQIPQASQASARRRCHPPPRRQFACIHDDNPPVPQGLKPLRYAFRDRVKPSLSTAKFSRPYGTQLHDGRSHADSLAPEERFSKVAGRSHLLPRECAWSTNFAGRILQPMPTYFVCKIQ